MKFKNSVSLKNRCNTCLMPDHAVTINQHGCNYCFPEGTRRSASVGEDLIPNDNKGLALKDIKQIASASTSKYDCLIGLSGGRDSIFLLYYVKNVLGLTPLAVNFRTRFQTDEARHNMRDAVSRLGIDFVSNPVDDLFFGKLVTGFFKKYGEFCSPCHLGHHYTLAKLAKEHRVPIIIRGISSKVDLNRIDPGHFDFFCKDEDEFRDRLEKIAVDFDITEEELKQNHDMLHLKDFKDKSILTIDLPDLMDWEYQQMQEVLDREFDWQHPKNQFFHCDCQMNPTLCHLEYSRHGFSEKQIIISNLLASGDINIEKGQQYLLSEEMAAVPENIDKPLALLDIDQDTFDKVVEKFWRSRGPK